MIDVASIKADAAFWGVIDKWALIIVIAGAIGEGLAEYPPKRFPARLRCPSAIRKLGRISWLVLVVGLVVETAAQLNKDADNDLLMAALEADAKNAELELAKFRQNRSLDVAATNRIAEKLRQFKGQPFDVTSDTSFEPVKFAQRIAGALVQAGWAGVKPDGQTCNSQLDPSPVPIGCGSILVASPLRIEIAASRLTEWQSAVVALREALHDEGFDAETNAHLTGVAPNAIHVLVGIKR